MTLPFPSFANTTDNSTRVLLKAKEQGDYFSVISATETIDTGASGLITLLSPTPSVKIEYLEIMTGSCNLFSISIYERNTMLPQDLVFEETNLNGESGRVLLKADIVYTSSSKEFYVKVENKSSSSCDFTVELRGSI